MIYQRYAAVLAQKIKTQSGRNAFVSGGCALLNPLLQLAATPILFRELGPAAFGIWALVNAVLATSGIASLGLGEAAIKFVALNRTAGNHTGVVRAIRTALFCYMALGSIAGCAIAFAAGPLAEDVFRLSREMAETGILAFRIAAVGLLARFLYAVFESALRGLGRYDLEAMWAAGSAVGATVTALLVVICGGNLAGVLIAGVAATLLAGVGMAVTLRRQLDSWCFLFPIIDKPMLRQMMGFGFFTWLQTINGVVLQQLDRIVIGAMLGVTAAGYYSICLQLVQTGHMILARASAFIFPLAIRYHAAGQKRALWNLFRDSMTLLTILGWVIAGAFFIFGHQIVSLWMGAEVASSTTQPLRFLAVWGALLAASITPFYFLNATGNERLNTTFALISGPVFVAFALVLIPSFGIIGAAASRLGSVLLTFVITRTILFRRVFGDKRWFSGLSTMLPTVASVSIAAGGLALSNALSSAQAFATQLAAYALSIAICVATSWLLYHRLLASHSHLTHDQA